jgi:hypothetical protein
MQNYGIITPGSSSAVLIFSHRFSQILFST